MARVVRDGYALPQEAYAPQCPVMVLRGGRDPYARYAGPEISGAERHTLRAAAHCPAETDADAVCDHHEHDHGQDCAGHDCAQDHQGCPGNHPGR